MRRARPDDLERCRELVAEAIAAGEGHRGADLLFGAERGPALAASLVERWHGDADSELVVGTYSEAVVGVAAGTVTETAGRPVGRIECFYVEPEARAVGVGQAIVGSLVEGFAGRGCRDVDATALPGDRSSKQLLEALGFKTRLLIIHRSLG